MLKAEEVSKYLISRSLLEKKAISNLQLNRILYDIQLNHLKWFNKPLFNEDFEAWNNLIVIPSIYYKYCGFGAEPILLTYEVDIPNDIQIEIDDVLLEDLSKERLFFISPTKNKSIAWELSYKEGTHSKISKDLILKDVYTKHCSRIVEESAFKNWFNDAFKRPYSSNNSNDNDIRYAYFYGLTRGNNLFNL